MAEKQNGQNGQNETNATRYRVVVTTNDSGLYATNALTYETIEDADAAGRDLFSRWLAVREYAVIPVTLQPDADKHYWTADAVSAARQTIGGNA